MKAEFPKAQPIPMEHSLTRPRPTHAAKLEAPMPIRTTFVLPGRDRSGGVRVTVEMANRLIEKGYKVRIACRAPSTFSRLGIGTQWRRISYLLRGISHFDWLEDFKGSIESFGKLEDVAFLNNEVVIAVGSMTIQEVFQLDRTVIKLRYCHGLPDLDQEWMHAGWKLDMPTLSVSDTLSNRLEELSGRKPFAIVPNGISARDYHLEDRVRDGIGAVYSVHPRKAPKVMEEVFRRVRERWPSVPQYVFGSDPRPAGLPREAYSLYPSIARSRELYNRSKIWIVTSRIEGFGLPILEAMACGCAVISTEHDSAPGLIQHGINGFLVPIGDVDAFIHQIDVLLKDEALRLRIVQQAFETIRNYTWENAVSIMEDVLQKVMAGKTPPEELSNGHHPS